MKAVTICKELQKNIKDNNLTGIVHSVFNSVFNVTTSNNQFISFVILNKPMSPNAIRISKNLSFQELGIEPKMKLYFYDKYVWLEDINIIFEYDKAVEWDKSPIFGEVKSKSEELVDKIDIMKEFLIIEGKREGILPLLTFLNERYIGFELLKRDSQTLGRKEQFIKERFLSLIDAYIEGDKGEIADRVGSIIGFGAGLTPSMDDFICGLMIARVYLFNYLDKNISEALAFNQQMIMKIDDKTTRVSEEMLKFSSKAEVNEDIRNLMISLISDIPVDEYIYNLKVVARYGETSGTDIISGIYIGSKILFNQYSRR